LWQPMSSGDMREIRRRLFLGMSERAGSDPVAPRLPSFIFLEAEAFSFVGTSVRRALEGGATGVAGGLARAPVDAHDRRVELGIERATAEVLGPPAETATER
jgi:hypothetical protein